MTEKQEVVIVALSVDSRFATLYMSNGETLSVAQGDPRLPRIVAQAQEQKLGNGSDTAIIDLSPVVGKRDEFADAETGTKGLVKFFRVARSFLKSLVDTESPDKVKAETAHVNPVEIGIKPGERLESGNPQLVGEEGGFDDYVREKTTYVEQPPELPVEPLPVATPGAGPANDPNGVKAAEKLTADQKIDIARDRLNQISGNGVDTSHEDFHRPMSEEETIVAVNTQTGSVIPDAHKLTRQLRESSKLKSYTGLTNFINRLEHVIHDRGHSVEDLMKFIELGDLPIADDGCIVVYKRLNSRGDDVFSDVHSGKVRQRVGSYVFMRAGLVDPSRRNDCSNGLHIASLSYLSSFSGGVTTICKVRPEDVFAVPEYSLNKMRVCGYHIVYKLSDKLKNIVNRGGSITSEPEGAQILNNILRGNHIGVIEHVEIGGNMGADLKITKVSPETVDNSVASIRAEVVNTTLDMSESTEPSAKASEFIKPSDLVKPEEKLPVATVNRPKSKAKAKKTKAKKTTAKSGKTPFYAFAFDAVVNAQTSDVAHEAAQRLLSMKAGAKKGWDKLGFTTDEVNQVMAALKKQSNPKADEQLAAHAKAEKRKESGKGNSNSPAGLIRALLDQAPLSKEQYGAILLLKRKAKKGWAALGVSASEQADIEKNTK